MWKFNFSLFPDETVVSAIARYHYLSANCHETQTYQCLLNKSRFQLHPYLTKHIKVFANNLALDTEDLLNNHTLYPLFSAFSLHSADKLKSAMLGDKLSVINNCVAGHSKLAFYYGHKYCPICIENDKNKVGVGYFHIAHQIPGVDACHLHGCLLQGMKCGDAALGERLRLPLEYDAAKPASTSQMLLANFATHVHCISKSNDFKNYRQIYLEKLNDLSLITKHDHLRYQSIIKRLYMHWQDLTFGEKLGLPEKLSDFSFIGPLLRDKTHYQCHPIKHLLFACWLFEGDASLYLLSVKPKRQNKQHDDNILEKIEIEVIRLLKTGVSISQITKRTGKSYCYVNRIANNHRIDHLHNANGYPEETRRKAWFMALAGKHRKDISDTLGVSIGYVEQVISADKTLVKWRKHLRHAKKLIAAIDVIKRTTKEHPDWTRKQIKQAQSAAFFLIYLDDKNLLEKLLPKAQKPIPPTKNWARKDTQLCEAIRALKIEGEVSKSEIARQINDRGFIRRYLCHLPKTKALLEIVSTS